MQREITGAKVFLYAGFNPSTKLVLVCTIQGGFDERDLMLLVALCYYNKNIFARIHLRWTSVQFLGTNLVRASSSSQTMILDSV